MVHPLPPAGDCQGQKPGQSLVLRQAGAPSWCRKQAALVVFVCRKDVAANALHQKKKPGGPGFFMER
jgi:hypothetical protein